jgi:MFS-type transporter involved in bile tolerance (Atg22 family)
VVGGVGGRYLYQIDVRYPSLLAGITAIIGCFPLWYLLNHVDSTTPYYVSASSAIVAGLGAAPTGPIIKATLTNVTLPTARGQAFAMFNLFDDFGKGLGPFFVSLLIVNMGGRLPAFNIGVFGWIICGVANLAIFFTVKRDEQKVQMELSEHFQSVSSTVV